MNDFDLSPAARSGDPEADVRRIYRALRDAGGVDLLLQELAENTADDAADARRALGRGALQEADWLLRRMRARGRVVLDLTAEAAADPGGATSREG